MNFLSRIAIATYLSAYRWLSFVTDITFGVGITRDFFIRCRSTGVDSGGLRDAHRWSY